MSDRTYDPFIMRNLVDNAVNTLNQLVQYAKDVLPQDSGMRYSIERAAHAVDDCLGNLDAQPYSKWVGVADPAAKTYTREEAVEWAINNAIGDLEDYAPQVVGDLTGVERDALLRTLRAVPIK